MLLAGFDVGSSSVKLSILDVATNEAVFTAQYPDAEMPITAHRQGWAEQDPDMWWQAIIILAKKAADAVNSREIAAIGISYQMHGLVCLDKNLNALRPSIIWCDSRAVPYGEAAYARLGEEYCRRHLLNSPGNFTAAKLAWVKENEPELYERIRYFMLPGDYIATRLSGDASTTYAGLSEGIFYDFVHTDVSSPLMKTFGFSEYLIPPILESFSREISLSKMIADLINWPAGIPISYRAGDQPNNAFSLNVLHPGEVAATAGTSGVVYGVTDQAICDSKSRVNSFVHVNHTPADPRIGVLLCINGTGILNAWGKRLIKLRDYVQMNKLAENTPIGSRGLRILPFGNGAERIFENRYIGSHWLGIDFNVHGDGDIARAIQEGIACSFHYGLEIMKNLGVSTDVIRAGEANLFLSPLFREAVSALTGAEIQLFNTDGSQGAARGAGIGLGVYSLENAFSGLRMISGYKAPLDIADQYRRLYEDWCADLGKFM